MTQPMRRKRLDELKIDKIVDETWDTKTFYFVDADDGGRRLTTIKGVFTFRYDGVE